MSTYIDKKDEILGKYLYELPDVESISEPLWKEIRKVYSQVNLSLDDLLDFNIVKIAFSKGSSYEIQPLSGTSKRMMVLPMQAETETLFGERLKKVTIH